MGLAVRHRTGEAILDFPRRVVLAEFPRGTIYPIWDNLSTPTQMAIFRRLSGSRFDAPETILYAAK